MKKNKIGQKSVEIGPKTPPPPLKIHTFKKVWIWGRPFSPQCGKNPHFLFFSFEGFPKKYLQMNFDEDGWMENQILEGQITA